MYTVLNEANKVPNDSKFAKELFANGLLNIYKDGKWVKDQDYDTNYKRSNWTYEDDWAHVKQLPNGTVLGNGDYEDVFAVVYNGEVYMMGRRSNGKIYSGYGNISGYAQGTTDLNGAYEYTRINEFGTEGIITPQGTFTALPSHTGIVPADITKNVWELGEVAPTLIAELESLKNNGITSNNGGTVHNDGTFIDNLNMTVYPTKDYDMEKFLAEARAKARITRHNN